MANHPTYAEVPGYDKRRAQAVARGRTSSRRANVLKGHTKWTHGVPRLQYHKNDAGVTMQFGEYNRRYRRALNAESQRLNRRRARRLRADRHGYEYTYTRRKV